MLYRLAGEDATFTIDFKVDGEFVVPDESSVLVTVRGADGVPLAGYNRSPVGAANVSTTYQLEIVAAVQTITENFTPRYLTVYYSYLGREYNLQLPYRVHTFIPLTVTVDDVRDIFGAEYRELPDQTVDILESYLSLVQEYGSVMVAAFLDLNASHRANLALGYYAALGLLPTMRSRLLSSEKNDTSEFQRFKQDFERLEFDLNNRFLFELGKTFELMNSDQLTTVQASALYSSFIVSAPPDPFTGS